jgi:hypothetical protein
MTDCNQANGASHSSSGEELQTNIIYIGMKRTFMVAGIDDMHRATAWWFVVVAVRMRREMDSMVVLWWEVCSEIRGGLF